MSMKFLKTAGFKVEEILKSNKYFNGKYFDMYIFSLYKEDFSILKKKLKMNNELFIFVYLSILYLLSK